MAKKLTSAEKRHRQSEERRMRNKSVKTAVKTSVKKFLGLAQKRELVDAEAALEAMTSRLDSAARKGIIKKNTAARKKSRMQRLLNTLKAGGPAPQAAGGTAR